MLQEYYDRINNGEGSQYTNRNEYDKIFIPCPCGNKVKLTWQ